MKKEGEKGMDQVIERIARMEALYDEVSAALDTQEGIPAEMRAKIGILQAYMEDGTWLADYELDEQGAVPRGMKRGVLSQDGLYDLLMRVRDAESD